MQHRRATGSLAHRLDALVSTDGDADRPLVADEAGAFIRGDVLGILTAQFLGADAVVTPVTSNSAIEGLGAFAQVIRTKVGSPFVIAGMEAARRAAGHHDRRLRGEWRRAARFRRDDRRSRARGAADARRRAADPCGARWRRAVPGKTLGQLVATLPPRIALSDRLEHVPQERTAALLERLAVPDFAARYFAEVGEVASVSPLDGLRFILTSGDVVHYRASGNAPELRCYTEASTAARAETLLAWGLRAAEAQVR